MRIVLFAIFSFMLAACGGKPVEPERNKDGSWNPEDVEAYEKDVRSWCEGKKSTPECQQLFKNMFEMKRINEHLEYQSRQKGN
jgi:hypothetical protein